MNNKIMMSALALSLTAVACIGPEVEQDGFSDEPVGEATAALVQHDLTVVAWADQGDIVAKAYCTDFDLVSGSTTKCTCDGLEGTGIYNGTDPDKCTMCKQAAGGWPCSVKPTDPNDTVSVTFFEGGNGHIAYMALNSSDQPVQISLAETLACGGTESRDFAIVRSWANASTTHILARGDMSIGLDCNGN